MAGWHGEIDTATMLVFGWGNAWFDLSAYIYH